MLSTGWGPLDLALATVDFQPELLRTTQALLAQEDTDADGNITVDDGGPKRFLLQGTDGTQYTITGAYQLANFLQELSLIPEQGTEPALIAGYRICENPVDRIRRRIHEEFWENLTRRLDASAIFHAAKDPKFPNEVRIYIPFALHEQYAYYKSLSEAHPDRGLEVIAIPQTSRLQDYSHDIRNRPGILALAMRKRQGDLEGLNYIVPGYRFDELYYWDSYFAALGLLEAGKIDLVRDIVENMEFQIEHYGSVLNANRTYYLDRSQPPFLTDLVIRTYRGLSAGHLPDAEEFLRTGILFAIREYFQVWTCVPRLDPITDLSMYRPQGRGIPPEVEKGHFDWYLKGHAERRGKTIVELYDEYNTGTLKCAEMDSFFAHDRAMRESGHDTTTRFCAQAADLATIDLNALLYKYETDIAWAIKYKFNNHFDLPQGTVPGTTAFNSAFWTDRANSRKWLVTRYLWNDETGMFHDYNTVTGQQTPFKSATTFYALWSGLATTAQANRLVSEALPQFEQTGGLSATARDGIVNGVPSDSSSSGAKDRQQPKRQWDFPFGWAPHQMMAWEGLRRYGYNEDARRLTYRWLYLITRIAVDYNGMVTERYDVTSLSKLRDKADAEYGNQGTQFRGVNREGFGWTNASYVVGLEYLGPDLITSLKDGLLWEDVPKSRG